MFGFKAFSEAPISAEVEAQATVIENVGAIGASAIGVHAIGRATTQTAGVSTVSATASASIPAITLTSSAPTVTVSSTASATAATITVTSPAPTATATTSVTASATAATITVTSPASTAGVAAVASATLPSVTLTAPEPTPKVIVTTVGTYRNIITTERYTGTPTSVSLSLPTGTFSVPSSASTFYSSFTLTSGYDKYYVDWTNRWVVAIGHGAPTTTSNTTGTTDYWRIIWGFDDYGNLSMQKINRYIGFGSVETQGQITNSIFIHGDLADAAVLAGNGHVGGADVVVYTVIESPKSTTDSSGAAGDYLILHSTAFSNVSSGSPSTTTRVNYSDTYLQRNRVGAVNSFSPNYVSAWGTNAWVYPWRGDWSNRSRENYFVYSYKVGSNYYVDLVSEDGTVINVTTTTTESTADASAANFQNGTYTNYVHQSHFTDDGAFYKGLAATSQLLTNSILVPEIDVEVEYHTIDTSWQEISITSPAGIARQDRTASATLPTVTVSSPQPTTGGNSTGAGAVGTVSISTASPTVSISSTASAALATVSVTSPASTASGTASRTASASIPSITVGAPLVGETVVEIPLPTPSVTISSPAVQPVINSTASATAPSVTVTTPQASVSLGIGVNVTLPSITVNAPAPSVSSSSTVSLDLHKASQTFTVTVQSTAYGNKYYIDGVQQASLSLHEEGTYRFDLSDSSVSNHPLRFSTTSNGTHNSGTQYTTGVTVVGTAGSSGAYVEIVVTSSTPDLYYYCTNHSGMGGSIAFSSDFTQVPFILPLSAAAATLKIDSVAEAQAASVTLTAAEASATGGAVATFADSIEVGITAPAPTITVSSTITITDTPTITISSPSPSGDITANTSLPSITVTTPAGSATADFDATASASLPTITITSPTGSAIADTETDDVDGSSTATGSGVLLAKGESSLNATATASSTEVLQANGAGSLVGQSTATAVGGILRSGAASVSGSTNASASCTILKDVGSTVNATSTCSGTGLSLLNSSSSVDASSTCSGLAVRELGALATVSSTSTIVASSFVLTPLVAGDVNKLTTITIPADHPRVVTVFADTRRFLTVQSDRPRLIRIMA